MVLHRQAQLLLLVSTVLTAILAWPQASPQPASKFTPQENDYILPDFHFKSGETLPELRMHYMTLGKPVRDANGRVTNAVLILHGTGGSGRQFLQPQFADVLYGPTTSDTASPANRAMACTRGFRNTITTTWCAPNMSCLRKGWESAIFA